MAEITLKPCPFCGSRAEFETNLYNDGHRDYYIYCTNKKCNINRFWSGEKSEAIASWNHRIYEADAQMLADNLTKEGEEDE